MTVVRDDPALAPSALQRTRSRGPLRGRLPAPRPAAPAIEDNPAVERYELPPERLGRWLARWADAHGGVAATEAGDAVVTFTAADGAVVECEPPFPPVEGDLLEHVARVRTVGVLLVRLGGHAAGVFRGATLLDSKVDTKLVHGRHRKGGSSAGRFARRRAGQARVALAAAADVAVRVLRAPAEAGELDAVVLGGDRRALATVLEDPRLAAVRALAAGRVLEVGDPRLAVLRAAPDAFRATVVRVR
jgi:hypothetical protein